MAIILVADDNTMLRKTIRTVLEKANHTVLEAQNGEETIRILRDSAVDVLLLDVIMPGKGGLETMLEMNSGKITTRIVVMTGKLDTTSEPFQAICRRFHAEKILTKPFTNISLLQTIAEITQPPGDNQC